jgi:WD40 repeat protein
VLSPDGSKFATVSADKSIAVFDAVSGEMTKHFKTAHAMGVYDLSWIDNHTFVSCSADNLVKKWHVD